MYVLIMEICVHMGDLSPHSQGPALEEEEGKGQGRSCRCQASAGGTDGALQPLGVLSYLGWLCLASSFLQSTGRISGSLGDPGFEASCPDLLCVQECEAVILKKTLSEVVGPEGWGGRRGW